MTLWTGEDKQEPKPNAIQYSQWQSQTISIGVARLRALLTEMAQNIDLSQNMVFCLQSPENKIEKTRSLWKVVV